MRSLLLVVALGSTALARPKVAVAPVDGDDDGRVTRVVADLVAEDAKLTSPEQVERVMHNASVSTVTTTSAKRLRAKLQVDVIVYGRLRKQRLTLTVAGPSLTSMVDVEVGTTKELRKELGSKLRKRIESASESEDEGSRDEGDNPFGASRKKSDEEDDTRSARRDDDKRKRGGRGDKAEDEERTGKRADKRGDKAGDDERGKRGDKDDDKRADSERRKSGDDEPFGKRADKRGDKAGDDERGKRGNKDDDKASDSERRKSGDDEPFGERTGKRGSKSGDDEERTGKRGSKSGDDDERTGKRAGKSGDDDERTGKRAGKSGDDDERADDEDRGDKRKRRGDDDDREGKRVADDDERRDDEEDDRPHRRKHHRDDDRPRHPLTQAALWLDAGGGFARRTLAYEGGGMTPPPGVGTGAPAGRIEGEVYPASFSSLKGPAAGIGVFADYDRELGLSIAVPGANVNAPIRSGHESIGARYRFAFGSSSIAAGVAYWRRWYIADRTGLMDPKALDMPDVKYKAVAPGAIARFAATSKIGIYASVDVPLMLSTGPLQDPKTSYGASKIIAFDIDAGVQIAIGAHYAVQIGAELDQVGHTFTGQTGSMSVTRNVTAATDRSITVAATLGVMY